MSYIGEDNHCSANWKKIQLYTLCVEMSSEESLVKIW